MIRSCIPASRILISLAATTLYTDVTNAKALYSQKRDHFKSLSSIYSDRVPVWSKEDRQRRFLNKKKEIECVYRHNPGKGTYLCLSQVWELTFSHSSVSSSDLPIPLEYR